jgi:hypothetical protein
LVPTLRQASLLTGVVLTTLPPFIIFFMAAGFGDLDGVDSILRLLFWPTLIGMAFGVGPVLVGMPELVAGARRPQLRLLACFAMLVSLASAGFAFLKTYDDNVGLLMAVALAIEIAAFSAFIWPARRYAVSPSTIE